MRSDAFVSNKKRERGKLRNIGFSPVSSLSHSACSIWIWISGLRQWDIEFHMNEITRWVYRKKIVYWASSASMCTMTGMLCAVTFNLHSEPKQFVNSHHISALTLHVNLVENNNIQPAKSFSREMREASMLCSAACVLMRKRKTNCQIIFSLKTRQWYLHNPRYLPKHSLSLPSCSLFECSRSSRTILESSFLCWQHVQQ